MYSGKFRPVHPPLGVNGTENGKQKNAFRRTQVIDETAEWIAELHADQKPEFQDR